MNSHFKGLSATATLMEGTELLLPYLYITEENDTLGEIAERLDLDPKELMRINRRRLKGLQINARLKDKTELLIPASKPIGFSITNLTQKFQTADKDAPGQLGLDADGANYIAAEDETPRQIADKIGVDTHDLMTINLGQEHLQGLTTNARLREGTILQMPYKYTAKEDETLKEIALHVGMKVKDLLEVNRGRYEGLTSNSPLMAGTELLMPKRALDALVALEDKVQEEERNKPQPPARPQPAFVFWEKVHAEKLAKLHSDLNSTELRKLHVDTWNALSFAGKAQFVEMAQDDRKRYLDEKAGYEKWQAHEAEVKSERNHKPTCASNHKPKETGAAKARARVEAVVDDEEVEEYSALEDETLVDIAGKLNIEVPELLRLNKPRYKGLTQAAKLMEGTSVLVPKNLPGIKQKPVPPSNHHVLLTVGNTHSDMPNGEKPHRWSMFVRGPDPRVRKADDLGIEKVVFHLHPDYSPSDITVSKSPFEVTRYGWGTFDVKVDIYMAGGKKEVVEHSLNFQERLTSDEIALRCPSKKRKMPDVVASRPSKKAAPSPNQPIKQTVPHSQHLSIGNTHAHVKNNDKPHRWTLFVRGTDPSVRKADDLGIEKVVFHLHPDYSPSDITVSKSPFEVTRYGWGTFDVKVDIYMARGKKEVVEHCLVFDGGISVYKTVPLSIRSKRKR
eukprot:TRINITY_DN6424_c0_g3_i1.p1 TRINITY_DN6424_c0_g3~~TRINITY_DN6424_c0_g3_i1.p1  ORF type:complete len:676 (-),score=81.89 TRINITY_DN6424_c0_g3_i1:243-2270(-)